MTTKEEPALAIDEAPWDLLRAHLERSGLIFVARDLDLAEAAKKLADDDAVTVGCWIKAGKLTKPSPGQIAEWDRDRAKLFNMLIVSPYVLMQEK